MSSYFQSSLASYSAKANTTVTDALNQAERSLGRGAAPDILNTFSADSMSSPNRLSSERNGTLSSPYRCGCTSCSLNRLSAERSGTLSPAEAARGLSRPVFGSLVGLPDSAAAFTTVTNSGQRIYNGNKRNFSANDLRKWTRPDGKSDGRGATVVTFAFDNDFDVDGIDTSRAKTLVKTALQTWAEYAPLDFVEVGDPGSGDLVDILVQSDYIDGRSGTLAYAYFPNNGDITFDNSEDWNESTFLETAVHELGHSLGLDHEDDTDAIMNSVLGNRFSSGAYLFEDDVNGIRSLYGAGKGSVLALGEESIEAEPAEPIAPVKNLVTNGSFEDSPVRDDRYGIYRQLNGWSMISGNGFQVDKRQNAAGKAADGSTWVELDTYGKNATIGQNIDTVTGQDYQLSVSFTDGGRPAYTTNVEVFWDGKKLDTLTGGGKGEWKDFTYDVKGGSRTVSTLAFRAVGQSDNVGGFIDNIVVSEARQLVASPAEATMGAESSTPTMNRDPLSSEPNNLFAADTQGGHFCPKSMGSAEFV